MLLKSPGLNINRIPANIPVLNYWSRKRRKLLEAQALNIVNHVFDSLLSSSVSDNRKENKWTTILNDSCVRQKAKSMRANSYRSGIKPASS
ncbi:hypothetical protein TNIN_116811 [Trichonephila inaurata madagascariensis]|uniref:Uncharacterized protein n=1 Tax=Trichonephila inaurata madagascariensis TaxID=2747483 RepID=A0A8X7CJU2_9ARAC|nr:hypothetical protein TNIN_116811 [Trichonephila inaurata madagascariensis]